MRRLTAQEQTLVSRLKNRNRIHSNQDYSKLRVRYDYQDNYTIAVIQNGSKLYTGVSKFNPTDKKFSFEIGNSIALTRALTNAYGITSE